MPEGWIRDLLGRAKSHRAYKLTRALAVLIASTIVVTVVTVIVTNTMEPMTSSTPAASPSASPSPAGELGFHAAVTFDYPGGQTFALPSAAVSGPLVTQLLQGFGGRDETSFLRDNGGAAVEDLTARVVLTGTSEQPTTITAIRVRVMSAVANLSGTRIQTSSGGDKPTIPVTIDMDHATPVIRDSAGKPFFLGHSLIVTTIDRETLLMHFTAESRSYRWLLEVDHVAGDGSTVTSYLDAVGKVWPDRTAIPMANQFGLTGRATAYGIEYLDNYPAGSGFHVRTPATPSP